MISVQSHSKQIKLLNEYILALQRQVAAARKENEETQKNSKVGGDQLRKVSEELTIFQKENEQLKADIAKMGQELMRFNGLEQEYFAVRGYLQKELSEKQKLAANLQEVSANNKTLYERMQELEAGLAKKQAESEELMKKWESAVAENDRIGKENTQLKSLVDKKLNELGNLTNTFNAKTREYDGYMRRTNDEKASMLRIIRSLQDEKKQLEINVSSFKGDASETARALSTQTKLAQDLSLKLQAAQSEISALKIAKIDVETVSANLRRQLQAKQKALGVALRQKEEVQQKQSEVLRQKFNSETFFNNEIAKLQREISLLTKQNEELTAALKAKSKSASALQEQLKQVKAQYASFRNQSASLSDSHSSEVQLVRNKLRQVQRKNALNVERIEAMAQEMRELQIKLQNEHNSLQLSRQQLLRVKQAYNRQLNQVAAQSQQSEKKRCDQIDVLNAEKQHLTNKIKNLQQQLALLKQSSAATERQLKQSIKRVQMERDLHIQKLNSVSISSLLQNQNRSRKQGEVQSLRLQISALQLSLKEQNDSIEAIMKRLSEKEKQIQGLQQSNAALRKQIISSINNEQAAKKEVLEVRSKAGSVISGSRAKSSYMASLRGSAVGEGKSVRMNAAGSNIVRSGSSEKRTFNKKRTTPAQPRFSMIDQLGSAKQETTVSEEMGDLLQ